MSERILIINEIKDDSGDSYGGEEGYEIITDQRTLRFVIDSFQSCCESWGYFLTEDDPACFIGAELLAVELTDTNRSNRTFVRGYGYDEYEVPGDDRQREHLDEGGVMFVDIKTGRGTLQFVAYNAHNGWYGHTARVTSRMHKPESVELFAKGV